MSNLLNFVSQFSQSKSQCKLRAFTIDFMTFCTFLSLPSLTDAITHLSSVWLRQGNVKLSLESIHNVWGRVVTSEKLIL